MNRLPLIIALLAILTGTMAGILQFTFPASDHMRAEGFANPVIAFEFTETPEQLARLFDFADASEARRFREKMDAGNRLDFLFLFFYSGFLAAFAFGCYRRRNRPLFGALFVLAILCGAADIGENRVLLTLSASPPADMLPALLSQLSICTWLKWGGLSLYFLLIGAFHFYPAGGWRRWAGIAGGIPVLLGCVAWFAGPAAIERFTLSVTLCFGLLIIYALIQAILPRSNRHS